MKNSLTVALAAALVATGLGASTAGQAMPTNSAAAPLHLVNTYPVAGDQGWDYISVSRGAHRLYITRGTHLVVLDTTTGKQIGDITGLTGIHGVAVDTKAGKGYISDGRANAVVVFDLNTLQKTGSIPVGQNPDAILYDSTSNRVFAFEGRSNDITAIDPDSGKVVGTIALPGNPEFAVTDGNGHIFDNIESKSEIVQINSQTLKIENTWSLAPGDGPSGLAIDRRNHRLFSACDNQKMIVMDSDTGKVVATLPIGNGPDAAAFDPGAKRVYSPNGEDGTMSVYQENTPDQYQLLGTVSTRSGARTMAVDTRSHHVFVVTARPADYPAPGQPRRRYLPGTFVVLEYAP